MNKILVIGSTNIDMIACVKHLPRPGETVGEARFMQSNGGKGANQAVAAARLGGDVAFVSCLGDDTGAAALRQVHPEAGGRPRACRARCGPCSRACSRARCRAEGRCPGYSRVPRARRRRASTTARRAAGNGVGPPALG